jgi:hypothetical protein
MNVVVLGLFVDFALLCTMDHTAVHGNSLLQHGFDQTGDIGFSEPIDASL